MHSYDLLQAPPRRPLCAGAAVLLLLCMAFAAGAACAWASLALAGRRAHTHAADADADADPDASTPACVAPPGYTAPMQYATVWAVLGDEFAAGVGARSGVTWPELLRATAKMRTGAAVAPAVLNAAQQGGSLAQQLAAVLGSPEVQRAVDNREGVLLLVSHGVRKLADGAPLYQVADELGALANATAARTVLIAGPDPLWGGTRIDPALAACPPALAALNYPTLATAGAHRQLYAAQRALYTELARRHGWALVDTDAALGRYAWPYAQTPADAAFGDCEHYSELGQGLLADLLWRCMSSSQ